MVEGQQRVIIQLHAKALTEHPEIFKMDLQSAAAVLANVIHTASCTKPAVDHKTPPRNIHAAAHVTLHSQPTNIMIAVQIVSELHYNLWMLLNGISKCNM
jgi:hypothetical protein